MKTKTIVTFILIFFLTKISAQTRIQPETIKAIDKLSPLSQGAVSMKGFLGQKIDSCVKNGVMAKDYNLYISAFKDRPDDSGGFRGEFWGKWFTSAALAYQYQPCKKHKEIIDLAVDGLIKTQDKDGRLSSYKNNFGDWDIWGRKYALLGLVAYYDQTGDKRALKSATQALDDLISIAGPGKRKLTETGLSLLEALSSSSILEPIVLIYQRTGDQKYLDFAKYIVSLWSVPNKYTEKGMRLVEDAIAGVDPIKISAPKGYEQMSCFEGLCELYRATGEKRYLDALVTYGQKVREKEIMIVGSGSSGELWCDGAVRQTELMEQPMETCVTVTWMKFCYQLLRLTGDPVWADEMEVTLYNSLLGAMTDNGNWWAYFSPLAGERIPSPMQVPPCHSSCCVANGPRGLLTAPCWSVMNGKEGPVVNLYTSGTWKYKLPNGKEVELIQKTDYPKTDHIEISIRQKKPAYFTISLRIPEWSKRTKIQVNNDSVSNSDAGYAKITREWKDGDKIILSLDMRGRVITSPGNYNQMAIMRGPIVLALDNRMVKEENINLWLLHNDIKWKHNNDWNINYVLLEPTSGKKKDIYIDLKPSDLKPDDVWMAFEVPFLYRPTHFSNHKKTALVMCDYASAGNQYSSNNLFRVWLPQPMFMNDIFPKQSWFLLYEGKERPEMPSHANLSK
ncbi:MAG: glycoside hydrolase family 127 protein [Bacteroidota bacterium]|nr:glycoside hydrolase family 127 protein [Bacteroidota bacterium]